MSEPLKPGFYKATLDGETYQGLACDEGDFSFLIDGEFNCVPSASLTDARPLIVLDINPKSPGILNGSLVKYLQEGYWFALADQIEAQTKPARIPEPGWDGKVLAHTECNSKRREFVRFSKLANLYTWADGNAHQGTLAWETLIDPVLIREGAN